MSSRNVFHAASTVEVKSAVFPQSARVNVGGGRPQGARQAGALDKPVWASAPALAVERWWPGRASSLSAAQLDPPGQAEANPDAAPIEAAPIDAARSFEEARARGFEAGLQEGLAEAEAQLCEALEGEVALLQAAHRRLAEEVEALGRLRRAMMDEAEGQMVALAMEVGRRLACESLMTDTAWVAPLVRQAAAALTEADRVTCRLSPELAARLERDGAPLDVAGVGFEISNDLSEMEIVVESRFGRVDASFEERLDHLTQAVRARVEATPAAADWQPAAQADWEDGSAVSEPFKTQEHVRPGSSVRIVGAAASAGQEVA